MSGHVYVAVAASGTGCMFGHVSVAVAAGGTGCMYGHASFAVAAGGTGCMSGHVSVAVAADTRDQTYNLQIIRPTHHSRSVPCLHPTSTTLQILSVSSSDPHITPYICHFDIRLSQYSLSF